MKTIFPLALITALLLVPAAQAQAAVPPASPQLMQPIALSTPAALERLARAADKAQASWFTPDFAAALPSIRGGFKAFGSSYGAFQGVDDLGGGQYRLRYAGGSVMVEAVINAAGQLSKLFLKGSEAAQAATPSSGASPQTPQAALTRLAQADSIASTWFTPDFAAALPSIRGGFKAFGSSYGDFQGVDDLGAGQYRLRYAGGSVMVEAVINAAGQLSKLFLKGQQENVTAPAVSQTVSAALDRFFKADKLQSAWFAPDFLAAVPVQRLQDLSGDIQTQLGAYQGLSSNPDGSFTARFGLGILPVKAAQLDAQGRFSALLLGAPVTIQKPKLESVAAVFGALGDQSSVVVIENGKVRLGSGAEQKLAVGSAFKLGILAELQAQIKANQRRWDDVVTLSEADKSLPSGFLQTWPAGTPLTLQSLATLMISQSDNTATDLLLRVVGRDGVAQRLGLSTLPSTREVFALKNPVNKALLGRYVSGNAAQQTQVLKEAAAAPLSAATTLSYAPQAEWFVSATQLCKLMQEVAALPLTQINPGVADPAQFKSVSYKGGSDLGVLNFTTQLTTTDGRQVCISATLNSASALDEQAAAMAYGQILQSVR